MHVKHPSYIIQRLGDPNLIAVRLQYPVTGDLSSQGLTNVTYKSALRLRRIKKKVFGVSSEWCIQGKLFIRKGSCGLDKGIQFPIHGLRLRNTI
jgi:hypothetical protein